MKRGRLKMALVLVSLVLTAMLGGCSDGDGSDARISKLERRVAKLEAANRDLSLSLEARTLAFRDGIKRLDNRTWANDLALFHGVGTAQYDIQCGPNPQGPPGAGGCHVPLGTPGAVYTSDAPRRIFATPLTPR